MNNQDEVTRFTRVINERLNQMFSPRFEHFIDDRWKLTYYRPYSGRFHSLSVVVGFPALSVCEEVDVVVILPDHILLETVVDFLNMTMNLGETWDHPIRVTPANYKEKGNG